MTAKLTSAITLAILLPASLSAAAADKRYPDWPCHQLKVPELSMTAMWPEPLTENPGGDTAQVPGIDDIAAQLAARRTPMEEAEKQISGFIVGTPEQKKERANLLFIKLFDALNSQRSQTMNGIERAYRRQKDLAGNIRLDVAKLRELQDAQGDEARLRELGTQVEWETRIFDERRKTLTYACEVPAKIDQRLFALARAIRKAASLS